MGFGGAVALAALLAAGTRAPGAHKKGSTRAPDTLAPGQAGENANELFEKGRVAFARGEYQRAIEVLTPLLYPEALLDSEGAIVQSHRMLGVAHLYESHPVEAKSEFIHLLELRPDYRFDPLLDPAPVVDFFNQVLQERETQIAALEAQRKATDAHATRPPPSRAPSAPPVVVERRIVRNSFVVNFVPFGAGQFQNGQRKKGWMFLGAEASLGALSVAAFSTNFALYGFRPKRTCLVSPPAGAGAACPDGQVDTSAEDRSALLLRVQLVSGGLFWATVAWGVVDAVWHYQSFVTEPVDEPRAAPAPSVSIVPMVIDDGRGPNLAPGLALRF